MKSPILVLSVLTLILPMAVFAKNSASSLEMLPSHVPLLGRWQLVASHTPTPMPRPLWKEAKTQLNCLLFKSKKGMPPETCPPEPELQGRRNPHTGATPPPSRKPRPTRPEPSVPTTPSPGSPTSSPTATDGYDRNDNFPWGGEMPDTAYSVGFKQEAFRHFASMSGAERAALMGKIWTVTIAGIAVIALCTGTGEVLLVAGGVFLPVLF